jgi:hypothetical protein
MLGNDRSTVMAIHAFVVVSKDVNARDKRGHD